MKYFYSFFFILTISSSQSRIGDFESISSFLDVKSISLGGRSLAGVSESGLLALDIVDESIEIITIDNGLAYAGFDNIHKDKKNNLWIGSDNGIQIWNPYEKVLVNQFDLDIEELSGFVNYDDFIYCAAKINNTNVTTQNFMDYVNQSGISQEAIRNNLDNNIIEELLSGLVSTTLLNLEVEDFYIKISENSLSEKMMKSLMYYGVIVSYTNTITFMKY